MRAAVKWATARTITDRRYVRDDVCTERVYLYANGCAQPNEIFKWICDASRVEIQICRSGQRPDPGDGGIRLAALSMFFCLTSIYNRECLKRNRNDARGCVSIFEWGVDFGTRSRRRQFLCREAQVIWSKSKDSRNMLERRIWDYCIVEWNTLR